MKLFIFKDRKACDVISNAYIVTGRLKTGENSFNGFYLRFNIPLVKIRSYVNSNDFDSYVGPCRKSYYFNIRKIRDVGSYKLIKTSLWSPIGI